MEIKELKEVSPDIWFLVVVFLLATIIPGVLLLFLYDRSLFMEIDTFKMMLLGVSITAPVWIINIIVVGFVDNEKGDDEVENFKAITASGSIVSIAVLFIPIIIKIFIDLPLLWAIVIGIIIDLTMLLWVYYSLRNPSRKTHDAG